jgi:hypothetical protein
MKHMRILPLLLAALLLGSCNSTKIIGSWKNADIGEKQYGKIMIYALTSDPVAKGNVEERMAEVLTARKINAMGGGGIFNPEVDVTDERKHEIAQNLKSNGFDGVLTFALISAEEKTSYVPGSSYTYAPYSYGYYGSYWGYHGYYAPQVYTPGYYTSSDIYTVEACLYDVETEKLVWAARSETTNPSSLDAFANEYTETVVYQLMKDQMLKTSK